MHETARMSGWSATVAVAAVTAGLAVLAPASARAAAPPTAAAAPASLKANSLTWRSAQRGWVLGAASCASGTCSDVITTSNGGQTWSLAGTVPAPITPAGASAKQAGVSTVRFASATSGWAFGPKLYHTANGGHTWSKVAIPGGGTQVTDLAAGPGGAYAVVSSCPFGQGLCSKPLTFWRTSGAAGTSWQRTALSLPANLSADVAISGHTVYVIDTATAELGPGKFYVSTDGTDFSSRTPPCAWRNDVVLTQAVPTSATHVALLCSGNPGMDKAVKRVYTSADTAHHDTFAGQTGAYGISTDLAASPTGNLALAASSNGSFLYINDTGQTTWTRTVAKADGGAGWNDLIFTTGQEAWVIYSPVESFPGAGEVLVTHDAGQHWTPAKL